MITKPDKAQAEQRKLNGMRLALLMKARRARGRDKIKAVRDYVAMAGNEDCISKLVPLFEHEPANVFWLCFALVWPGYWSGFKWNDRLWAAMQRVGPHASVKRLPETLTVYRGCLQSRIAGISWTTNMKTAVSFARHTYSSVEEPADPCVAIARITRNDAFFVSNKRREREVICRPTVWGILDLDSIDDLESEAIKPSVKHQIVVTPIDEAARRPDSPARHVELVGS
jgi:hypothetical protein